MKTDGREGGDGCKDAIKKRKAEEEHPEDPERDDGKCLRTMEIRGRRARRAG